MIKSTMTVAIFFFFFLPVVIGPRLTEPLFLSIAYLIYRNAAAIKLPSFLEESISQHDLTLNHPSHHHTLLGFQHTWITKQLL